MLPTWLTGRRRQICGGTCTLFFNVTELEQVHFLRQLGANTSRVSNYNHCCVMVLVEVIYLLNDVRQEVRICYYSGRWMVVQNLGK